MGIAKISRVTLLKKMHDRKFIKDLDKIHDDDLGWVSLNSEKRFFENVRTSSLTRRFANMNEVANTIAYLSSPLSSATNGSVIKVEGGSTSGLS